MKYLVILYVTYKDDSKPTSSIYSYDSVDEAIQNFYKNMGKYVNVDNVLSVMVKAINSLGGTYKEDCWMTPADAEKEV